MSRAGRPPRSNAGPAVWVALALVLFLSGCSGLRTGPVERPEPYPDQSTPEAAWHTFLWALQSGDLAVLDTATMFYTNEDIEGDLRQIGREKMVTRYRETWADLRVLEGEWTHRGEALARVRVVLSTRQLPRLPCVFIFTRRPDGWAVSQQIRQP